MSALSDADVVDLFDRADDGLVLLDAEGTITYGNAAAATLLGLAPGAPVVGRHFGRPAAFDGRQRIELVGAGVVDMHVTPVRHSSGSGWILSLRGADTGIDTDVVAASFHEIRNNLTAVLMAVDALAELDDLSDPDERRDSLLTLVQRRAQRMTLSLTAYLEAARIVDGALTSAPSVEPRTHLAETAEPTCTSSGRTTSTSRSMSWRVPRTSWSRLTRPMSRPSWTISSPTPCATPARQWSSAWTGSWTARRRSP